MPVFNPDSLTDAPRAFALALLFVLCLAGAFVTTPGLARRSGFSKREGLWLLGITAFGLALRVLLPPISPFHESYHGYPLLHNPPPFMHMDVAVLYPVVLRLFGLTDGNVLLFNLGLSTLNVALIGLVTRALFKESAPGLIAALALAIFPLAIRMAPTASFFNLAVSLFLLAAWQGLMALERDSWKLMLLAALSAFLATTVRSMTVVLAPALLLLLAGAGGLRRWRLLLVAGLALAGSALQAGQMLRVTLSGQVQGLGNTFIPPLDHALGIFAFSGPAPLGLAILAGAGLLGLTVERRYRRLGITLALVIVFLNLAGSSVYQTPRIYRHLLVASSFACVAVGAGAWYVKRAFLDNFPSLGGAKSVLVLVVWLLASVAAVEASRDFVQHRYAENEEFRFVREQSDRMPAGIAASVPMGRYTRAGTFVNAYMEWRAARRLGRDPARHRRFLYLGVACSSKGRNEEEGTFRETPYGPLQAGCAEALAEGTWQEFARIDVPGASYMGYDAGPVRDPIPLVVLLEAPGLTYDEQRPHRPSEGVRDE
jgi:hypothetical protein